ncbi:MAG: hypothetical protein IPK10_06165 [Bacteroidetes bacterium]|nr:hypothetical protein [Bacteroidota bacterium]
MNVKKWIIFYAFSSPFGLVASAPRELILKVSPLKEHTVFNIKKQMNCLLNVHFCGYDVASSCLFLRYDSESMLDTDIIMTSICALNGKIEVIPIIGYTIYDVIDGKLK